MEKKKNLGVGNTVLVAAITSLGVLAAIIVSCVLYYFTNCLSTAEVGTFYMVMTRFIEVAFTLCTMVLLAEAMHTILYKTVISREFEKKQNPKFVKFSYWFILGVVSVIIMYTFKMLLPSFNIFALFLVLLILKITQVMSKYIFIEYKVEKEEKALLYLVFSIIMVAMFMVEYFVVSNYIKPQYVAKINKTNEFYKVTQTIENNLEKNDIEAAKKHIAWAAAKTDNELIHQYAEIFENLPVSISEENIASLKESIKTISDSAEHNSIVLEENLNEALFTRALLIEVIIILVISIAAFVIFCEAENNAAIKAEKKATKKVATKKTTKTVSKKTETKAKKETK